MITIFTIPKGFTDPHINIIQRNALKSWTLLGEDFEVMLMGNDPGVAEVAKEFNVKHIPDIKINEFNTPMLNSAFATANKEGVGDILIYLNADIILTKELKDIIKKLPNEEFLAVGRRLDVDVEKELDFKDLSGLDKNSVLHSPSGIDYFIFRKGFFTDIPEFAVGRVGWDNWMIFNARKKGIKTIDLTKAYKAYHQNHGYSRENSVERKTNPEAQKNKSFTKNPLQFYNIDDTKYEMTEKGIKKKWFYWMPIVKRFIRQYLK